jgi:hypothetical protein
MNYVSMMLAVLAKRRGASNSEIAPLIVPLSGQAAAMVSGVSLLQTQRGQDALARETAELVGAHAQATSRTVDEIVADPARPHLRRLLSRRVVRRGGRADPAVAAVTALNQTLARLVDSAQQQAVQAQAQGQGQQPAVAGGAQLQSVAQPQATQQQTHP